MMMQNGLLDGLGPLWSLGEESCKWPSVQGPMRDQYHG